jgi:hypothetical protein
MNDGCLRTPIYLRFKDKGIPDSELLILEGSEWFFLRWKRGVMEYIQLWNYTLIFQQRELETICLISR